MTVSGTFTTVNAVGLREDLEDPIYRIDPTDTPLMSAIGRNKASGKFHEWQIQKLAATNAVTSTGAGSPASGDAALDGADAPSASTTPTVRVGNRTQIMTRKASVSGGLQAVDKAGRANEMAYQVMLKGLELKRQMETVLSQNQASQADNGTNPGLLGSFESWITTNTSRNTGAGGSNGGFSSGNVSAPGDGTQRTFTEALLKPVLANTYSAGGKPTMMIVGPLQKQVVSGFSGLSQTRLDIKSVAKPGVIIAAASVYVSDFGNIAILPDIFTRNRTALLVSPKFAKVSYLRSMRNWALAKTGDADNRQLLVEFSLEVCNEAAHAVVADLS